LWCAALVGGSFELRGGRYRPSPARYCPLNTGLRFSTKARVPSRAS
jgi:hypothetical protein